MVSALVPFATIVVILLGSGLSIGLIVVLAGRIDSFRIRRGVARIEAELAELRTSPAPLALAWKLHGVEGERAGYVVSLSFAVGGSLPSSSAGHGPRTMRALLANGRRLR